MTVAWLKEQQRNNPFIFNCQYLNDPTPTDKQHITEELILRHTIPRQHFPRNGRVFIAWDLGYSRKEYSDWSVGAVGMYDDQGRLFILDIARGRFSPYELVHNIFNLILRWRPARVGIENAGGAELLEPSLVAFSRQHRIHLPLDWLPVSSSVKKTTRIAGLQGLLLQDKLYFAAGLPDFEELKKEFVRFPKYKHDDIPDAISLLLNYATAVDIAWPDKDVDMTHAPVIPGCEVLGAGLIG